MKQSRILFFSQQSIRIKALFPLYSAMIGIQKILYCPTDFVRAEITGPFSVRIEMIQYPIAWVTPIPSAGLILQLTGIFELFITLRFLAKLIPNKGSLKTAG